MAVVHVHTDLSNKEPHRQVGVGRVVPSESLGGVMVNTLARNAEGVFDFYSKCNISHFHHCKTLSFLCFYFFKPDHVQAADWMVFFPPGLAKESMFNVEPAGWITVEFTMCIHIYKFIVYM